MDQNGPNFILSCKICSIVTKLLCKLIINNILLHVYMFLIGQISVGTINR